MRNATLNEKAAFWPRATHTMLASIAELHIGNRVCLYLFPYFLLCALGITFVFSQHGERVVVPLLQ